MSYGLAAATLGWLLAGYSLLRLAGGGDRAPAMAQQGCNISMMERSCPNEVLLSSKDKEVALARARAWCPGRGIAR